MPARTGAISYNLFQILRFFGIFKDQIANKQASSRRGAQRADRSILKLTTAAPAAPRALSALEAPRSRQSLAERQGLWNMECVLALGPVGWQPLPLSCWTIIATVGIQTVSNAGSAGHRNLVRS